MFLIFYVFNTLDVIGVIKKLPEVSDLVNRRWKAQKQTKFSISDGRLDSANP